MLQRLIGEDVEIAFDFDPGLENIEADPGQITQIVMNLAVNARDAMPKGGKLTIETKNVVLDESYEEISKDDIAQVLYTIAVNSEMGPCSLSCIDCNTSVSPSVIVEDLLSRDVLERTGAQRYKIKVGLFAEWLRKRGV